MPALPAQSFPTGRRSSGRRPAGIPSSTTRPTASSSAPAARSGSEASKLSCGRNMATRSLWPGAGRSLPGARACRCWIRRPRPPTTSRALTMPHLVRPVLPERRRLRRLPQHLPARRPDAGPLQGRAWLGFRPPAGAAPAAKGGAGHVADRGRVPAAARKRPPDQLSDGMRGK